MRMVRTILLFTVDVLVPIALIAAAFYFVL
jgi:hypothetical protein